MWSEEHERRYQRLKLLREPDKIAWEEEQLLDDARDEIARLHRLSPLCDDHGVGNGTRSGCPYCVIRDKDAALSKIDYSLGTPNEMKCSQYDVDYDEIRVTTDMAREIARLIAENASLLALLREVEWEGNKNVFMCPRCGNLKSEGHTADCRLAMALAKGATT